MAKLLVVAAWEPEIARFRDAVSGVRSQALEIVVDTLGVGLVEASIAMTRCVARHSPTASVLLGTCGAFARTPPLAPGAVVTGARAHLVDGSAVAGTAALPAPMPAAATFDAVLHDALVGAGARSVQIANTVGITTDDALAASLWSAGDHHVEHLEAFAFARACAVASLPCAVSLGVANMVGARGRAEWLANHVQASADAADTLLAALPAIAAALRQVV